MTQRRRGKKAETISITKVVRRRVTQLRKLHGWSAQTLADRCQEAGLEGFTRALLANFESGRRDYVTVEELLVLALVLDTSPTLLLDPIDESTPLAVGPESVDVERFREWTSGRLMPLPGQDYRLFMVGAPVGADTWDFLRAASVDDDEGVLAVLERQAKQAREVADLMEARLPEIRAAFEADPL